MNVRLTSIILCLLAMLILPSLVSAECEEYKVIDHGDRLEAVCVGQKLTDYEINELNLERARQDKELKYDKRTDKIERRDDQLSDLSLRKSEIRLEQEEIALEREKERLRRSQLKNDLLEDRHDDISSKLDNMISGKESTSKKDKKAKKATKNY